MSALTPQPSLRLSLLCDLTETHTQPNNETCFIYSIGRDYIVDNRFARRSKVEYGPFNFWLLTRYDGIADYYNTEDEAVYAVVRILAQVKERGA